MGVSLKKLPFLYIQNMKGADHHANKRTGNYGCYLPVAVVPVTPTS